MRRANASAAATTQTHQAPREDMRRLVNAMRREVEELRRERAELVEQLRFACDNANREALCSADLRVENDRLQAENERLREELAEVAAGISLSELHDSIRGYMPRLSSADAFDDDASPQQPW